MGRDCDSVLCCLGCLSLVPGLRKRIVSKVAFCPPAPPGYWIDDTTPNGPTCFLWNGTFCPLPSIEVTPEGSIEVKLLELKTSEGNKIWAFHLRRADSTKTILMSHGNSTDIGLMYPHTMELCIALKCDILAYEYSGYGCSLGKPNEVSMYRDIDCAFEYLRNKCSIGSQDIIVYGQSVGSAPTLDLASREQLGGVILHSALKSGLSVLKEDVSSSPWFDAFKNEQKIKSVHCPVFVLHGTNDQEIKICHGKALFEAAKNCAPPWWVEGAGHNNIEVYWRRQYFDRLREFMGSLSGSSRVSGEPTVKLHLPLAESPKESLLRGSTRCSSTESFREPKQIMKVADRHSIDYTRFHNDDDPSASQGGFYTTRNTS